MSEVIISGGKKLSGSVTVPPSKSIAHRLIIAASLAKGESIIENVSLSEDIKATAGAMKALGADISFLENKVKVLGINKEIKHTDTEIFCNESGSTLRFMIPLALSFGGSFLFTGSSRLMERPLDSYFEIFDKVGIKYEKRENGIFFSGKLDAGRYSLRGDVSSQYITGLIFALSRLNKRSEIEITTNLESAGYIDLTIDALSDFGVKVLKEGNKFIICENQQFMPKNARVEGDYSQAAFYLVANAIGNDVSVLDLNANSHQGDKEILSVINDMKNGGITLDVSQIPDLVPIIAVLATQTEGVTHIINAGRLRIKESDRLSAITKELKKMGAKICEEPEGLIIEGKTKLYGAEVYAHNDHRIAMSLAIAATVADGEVKITNSECVKKSYGNFWDDYFSLQNR